MTIELHIVVDESTGLCVQLHNVSNGSVTIPSTEELCDHLRVSAKLRPIVADGTRQRSIVQLPWDAAKKEYASWQLLPAGTRQSVYLGQLYTLWDISSLPSGMYEIQVRLYLSWQNKLQASYTIQL